MRKNELTKTRERSSLSVFALPSAEEIAQNLQNVNFDDPKLPTLFLPSLLPFAGQEYDHISFSKVLVIEIMNYTKNSRRKKIQLKLTDIYRIIDLFVPDIAERNRVKDFVIGILREL
jgi:hypothetical protein